jgi:uncharacterized protein (DUF1697 family)
LGPRHATEFRRAVRRAYQSPDGDAAASHKRMRYPASADMPRYAALLRGVSPTNAKMPELKLAVEKLGYRNVKTLLSSGNIVFDAPKSSNAALEKKVEAATGFLTIVRSIEELQALIDSDPFKGVRLRPDSKRIVTFLRESPVGLKLPIEQDEARVLKLDGNHLFTVYAPTPKGPVFMKLIETAAGKVQTTRTWDTVQKIASS